MKHILILISLFILCKTTHAQLSFGTKAGLSITGSGSGNSSLKSKKASTFTGGYINYRFKKKMSLQAEIIYSGEGNSSAYKLKTTKGKLKSGQIRIPLTFQYKFSRFLFTESGIQIKNSLSFEQKANGRKSIDLKDFYQSAALGLVFGGGYTFKNKLAGLKLGVRYNIEFPRFNGNGDVKKALNISFTYRISYKKR